MLCQRGASADTRAVPSGLPLLAYTIMSAEYNLSDTTDTLVALLAMGANPSDIPRDMWCDYVTGPRNFSPHTPRWCTTELRDALLKDTHPHATILPLES